jgi:hypothetical protein
MPLHHRRRLLEIESLAPMPFGRWFDALESKLKFFSSMDVYVE